MNQHQPSLVSQLAFPQSYIDPVNSANMFLYPLSFQQPSFSSSLPTIGQPIMLPSRLTVDQDTYLLVLRGFYPDVMQAISSLLSCGLLKGQENSEHRKKRKHNRKKIIDVIKAIQNLHELTTGVRWMYVNNTIPIIAIKWSIFLPFYKSSQSQPAILDDSIIQKFRPSKCEGAWIEMNKADLVDYGLPCPTDFDVILTYRQWWESVGVKPPAALKHLKTCQGKGSRQVVAVIPASPTAVSSPPSTFTIPPTEPPPISPSVTSHDEAV